MKHRLEESPRLTSSLSAHSCQLLALSPQAEIPLAVTAVAFSPGSLPLSVASSWSDEREGQASADSPSCWAVVGAACLVPRLPCVLLQMVLGSLGSRGHEPAWLSVHTWHHLAMGAVVSSDCFICGLMDSFTAKLKIPLNA
jgi:hypothetical protein